jgi:Mlc titration factor MtfA (ptsG expression regulator)
LRAAAEAGDATVLDIYGATNPAEFFAIATEAFFERPRALRERHPELYAALGQFFHQDPARDFSE